MAPKIHPEGAPEMGLNDKWSLDFSLSKHCHTEMKYSFFFSDMDFDCTL